MAVQVAAGYWDLDLESRELLLCPRSRGMFGLGGNTPKTLAGYDWQPRIHPDDMPVIEGELEAAGRRGEVYAARFRTLRPDGSTCEILGVGRPTTRNGKRFVGLNLDLGELAATAERESRSVARFMRTLASGFIRRGPANENHSQPWRAFPPVRRIWTHCGQKEAQRQRLLHMARATFEIRQLRKIFLSPKMLGEPAFDMLLALYTAPVGHVTSVQAVSDRIGVSASVAVRWLAFLVEEGLALAMETSDDDPGARSMVLTDKGRIALDEFFKASRPIL